MKLSGFFYKNINITPSYIFSFSTGLSPPLPDTNKTNKSSDSVILCGKFQTALSGGNKSTDSGGQQSLKILSYNIMPLQYLGRIGPIFSWIAIAWCSTYHGELASAITP